MKRALSLILALVLCLGLCACGGDGGNNKYVGTYSGYYGIRINYIADDGWGKERTVEGTRTLTLNSDGTGEEIFVGEDVPGLAEGNITVYKCPIKWEVVDGYLYVTGECTYLLNATNEASADHMISDRYTLEGKTLVDADSPDSVSGKLTKK